MSGSAEASSSRSRLKRDALLVPVADGAVKHVPVKDWVLLCGPGRRINAEVLRGIESGGAILYQANLYLRDQSSPSSVANTLLRYFRCAESANGKLDAESLAIYRSQLNGDARSQANTKSQVYGVARGFVLRLMSLGVVPEQSLPLNFKPTIKKPYPTLSQLAGDGVGSVVPGNEERLERIKSDQRLTNSTAITLLFDIAAIEAVHSLSMDQLESRIEDCELANQLIDELCKLGPREVGACISFNGSYGPGRSLDEALLILYAKFGFDLPAVDQWPPGVYLFLKARGFASTDVRKIFSDDREMLRSLAESVGPAALNAAKNVNRWTHAQLDQRTVPRALGLLYASYGRLLPISSLWPEGVVDYLKFRGWPPSRVVSAFFPSSKLHAHLMMMLLSHKELAPNVSSVLLHSSIETVLEGALDGSWDVHLGKKRGGAVTEVIDGSDRAMILVRRYQQIHRRALLETPGGQGWLKKEHCPLMLRIGGKKRLSGIGKYQIADASDMAARAMGAYAESVPFLDSIKNQPCARSFRSTITSMLHLQGASIGKIKSKLHHQQYSTTAGYVRGVNVAEKLRSRQLDFQQRLLSEVKDVAVGMKLAREEPGKTEATEVAHVVLTDDAAVSLWLAWVREIEASEARLMFESPARWFGYWQARLAEYHVLLSKVPSSQRKRAQATADCIILPRIE